MSPKTQIFAETLTSAIKLEVASPDTLDDVKTKIQEQHSLTFAGEPPKDGNTLEECGIHRENLPREVMNIFVKTPTGEKVTLEVEKSDTVFAVKAKIKDHLRLRFAGKQLEGDRTLAGYGIEKDSVLDVRYLPREAIQIFVKSLTGKRIPLEVENSDTLSNVKAKIQERFEIPAAQQRLVFAGRQLLGDESLAHYGIKEDSTIALDVRPHGSIQIFVKTVSGRTIDLETKSSDRIMNVKAMLERMEGNRQAQQALFFAGNQLEDHLKLTDCGVVNESILHLDRRQRL